MCFFGGGEGGKTLFRHAKECPDYDDKNGSSNRAKSSAKVLVPSSKQAQSEFEEKI